MIAARVVTGLTNAAERICEALEDHTLLPVIALAADLPEEQVRRILDDLVRRGIAERYTDDLWGLAS